MLEKGSKQINKAVWNREQELTTTESKLNAITKFYSKFKDKSDSISNNSEQINSNIANH